MKKRVESKIVLEKLIQNIANNQYVRFEGTQVVQSSFFRRSSLRELFTQCLQCKEFQGPSTSSQLKERIFQLKILNENVQKFYERHVEKTHRIDQIALHLLFSLFIPWKERQFQQSEKDLLELKNQLLKQINHQMEDLVDKDKSNTTYKLLQYNKWKQVLENKEILLEHKEGCIIHGSTLSNHFDMVCKLLDDKEKSGKTFSCIRLSLDKSQEWDDTIWNQVLTLCEKHPGLIILQNIPSSIELSAQFSERFYSVLPRLFCNEPVTIQSLDPSIPVALAKQIRLSFPKMGQNDQKPGYFDLQHLPISLIDQIILQAPFDIKELNLANTQVDCKLVNQWEKEGLLHAVWKINLLNTPLDTNVIEPLAKLPTLRSLQISASLPLGDIPLEKLPCLDDPIKVSLLYGQCENTYLHIQEKYIGPQEFSYLFQIPILAHTQSRQPHIDAIFSEKQTHLDPDSIFFWLSQKDAWQKIEYFPYITSIDATGVELLADRNIHNFLLKFPHLQTIDLTGTSVSPATILFLRKPPTYIQNKKQCPFSYKSIYVDPLQTLQKVNAKSDPDLARRMYAYFHLHQSEMKELPEKHQKPFSFLDPDMTILCGKQEFKINSYLWCCRNEHFKQIKWFGELQNVNFFEVGDEDAKPEGFALLVNYIEGKWDDATLTDDIEILATTIWMAECFEIQDLMDRCFTHLLSSLEGRTVTVEEIQQIREVAQKHSHRSTVDALTAILMNEGLE